MIFITSHAVERFQQRVAALPYEEAKAAILSHERAIEKAAEFHCEVVRCGDGSRLILDGHRVITVYARDQLPRQCRRSAHR
jgi:hypothetical protein